MKPNELFLKLPKTFWASVRLISQDVGYTEKGTNRIKVPSREQIKTKLERREIDFDKIQSQLFASKDFGTLLADYFAYRADILYSFVEPHLMDGQRARRTFEKFHKKLKPSRQVPMNKQSGEKKAPAYLTGLVNMLIEANSQGLSCDYDPHQLTLITRNGLPVRTLARRVDGAFPTSNNPVAVWEIKEYYYTTTFGSRVADGIYESLLDGLELEELRENEHIDVKHYLMIDAHDTWWNQGKSYLCRVIDMLHMGYIDEVLFGYEVIERMPALVAEWVEIANRR
jgi:hypothetical protein